jgi:hypothetical protein
MAIACESYPVTKISKDNFAVIQNVVCRFVDGLPVFTHSLVETYWAKVAAIVVCQNYEAREWLVWLVPSMTAWEGLKFHVVGLDSLLTYKRILAWFPDPVKNMETLLRCRGRLKWCLGPAHWRTYGRR